MNAPTPDDHFEDELRALLQSATATLEPTLTFDDVESLSLVGGTAPSRTWARAGAIGLTAAAAVGTIVWVGGGETPRVSSPSTPSTLAPLADATDPATSAPNVDTTATSVTVVGSTEALTPAVFDPINLLVVGVDRRVDCIPPDSPYAGGFPAEDLGARADAIMVLRLDPTAGTASVLSFPRDLWVTIAGREAKGRINSAMTDADPTRLIATLYDEFRLEVDHFVQLDYCGVRNLVDGIGGVDVPFQSPARDQNTGLSIDEPGCVRLDGLTALAYLRSRKFETMLPDGTWQADPVADLGRISRQQDFLLRLLEEWRQLGPTDVGAARALIATAQEHVVVDQDITIDRMLDIAGFLGTLDRDDVRSFTIESTGAVVGGQSVLLPQVEGDSMRSVLALFRGETMHPVGDGAAVVPETNPVGVVPPATISC